MKKQAIRTYNLVAFVIFPLIILVLAALVFLFIRKDMIAPTVDKNEVTSSTQTGELYEVLTIEEEDIYVVYAIGDFYRLDAENELIAFRGADIEAMKETIRGCDYGAYAMSYWEGKGENFNFTVTHDFKEYMKEIQSKTYVEGQEPDWNDITDDFSDVTLYDVSDYKGYEHKYNNGIGLSIVLFFLIIAAATIFFLVIELIIAVILKVTVFKGKKG